MKYLITGFEPFLSRTKNPSMEILPLLEEALKRDQVQTIVLPVVFDQVFEQVKEAIISFQPDVILHLGLAENRNKIALERVAINIKDARGPDNKGQIPTDEVIVAEGENAYFSTLPLRTFEQALKDKDIPVYISNTAGTYVCNNVMYHTLHFLKTNKLDHIDAGFIHLPLMKEQAPEDVNAMPLDMIKNAICSMIETYQIND
jgi:pyroglutamyl-peptidase